MQNNHRQSSQNSPLTTFNSNDRFLQEMNILQESLNLNLESRRTVEGIANPPTTPTVTPIEREQTTTTLEQTRSESTAASLLSTGWTNMYQIRQHSNAGFFDLPDR